MAFMLLCTGLDGVKGKASAFAQACIQSVSLTQAKALNHQLEIPTLL
jgi:hypothetical protein